jgi:hypothetical protein
MESGTYNEAWKSVKSQLGSPNDAGFYIDFDKHPYTLRIGKDHLLSLYKSEPTSLENGDLMSHATLKFTAPYYGFSDFDKEAFNDSLSEELYQFIPELQKS